MLGWGWVPTAGLGTEPAGVLARTQFHREVGRVPLPQALAGPKPFLTLLPTSPHFWAQLGLAPSWRALMFCWVKNE